MNVVYLHGFNSSHRSFNFLIGQLTSHTALTIDYPSHQHLEASLEHVTHRLPKGRFAVIGHSLGGILATHVASKLPERVSHLVTISSPLGGSRAAATLRWIPGYPRVFQDITPGSYMITGLDDMKLPVPTLSLVSTGGSLPTSLEPNDGVVSVASQKGLHFGRKHEIKANHFEILQHERTVKLLQDFLFEEHA